MILKYILENKIESFMIFFVVLVIIAAITMVGYIIYDSTTGSEKIIKKKVEERAEELKRIKERDLKRAEEGVL